LSARVLVLATLFTLTGTATVDSTADSPDANNGNGWHCIEISHGTLTVEHKILGNYIGTGVDGTSAANTYAYNGQWGMQMEDAVTNNLVAANVIGNNHWGGVHLNNYNVISNQITNNRKGTGVDGSALDNIMDDVRLDRATMP